MKIEPGVLLHRADGRELIHPLVWYWVGKIEDVHQRYIEHPLVITSLARPGSDPSRHDPAATESGLCEAVDFRRFKDRTLPFQTATDIEGFCRQLQEKFGEHIGVVLEPEWLSPEQLKKRSIERKLTVPHVHVQLKKGGSKKWRVG